MLSTFCFAPFLKEEINRYHWALKKLIAEIFSVVD